MPAKLRRLSKEAAADLVAGSPVTSYYAFEKYVETGDFTSAERLLDAGVIEAKARVNPTHGVPPNLLATLAGIEVNPRAKSVIKKALLYGILNPAIRIRDERPFASVMKLIRTTFWTFNAERSKIMIEALREAAQEAADRYSIEPYDFARLIRYALKAAVSVNELDTIKVVLEFFKDHDINQVGFENTDISDLNSNNIPAFQLLVDAGWKSSPAKNAASAEAALQRKCPTSTDFFAKSGLELQETRELVKLIIHQNHGALFTKVINPDHVLYRHPRLIRDMIQWNSWQCLKAFANIAGPELLDSPMPKDADGMWFTDRYLHLAINSNHLESVQVMMDAGVKTARTPPPWRTVDEKAAIYDYDAIEYIQRIEAAGKPVLPEIKALIQAARARENLEAMASSYAGKPAPVRSAQP